MPQRNAEKLKQEMEELDNAVIKNPDAKTYRKRGEAKLARGDSAGAIEDFETANKLSSPFSKLKRLFNRQA